MANLLNLFLKYAGYRVEDKIAGMMAPIGPYVRTLTISVGCMVGAVFCFLLTLIFLALSFFMALASHPEWAIPALWTGIVAAVIGGLIAAISLSFFKAKQ